MVAQNPLLCTMLVHVLLRRGFAGPAEALRHLAAEAKQQLGLDISAGLAELTEPLRASEKVYRDAYEHCAREEKEPFRELCRARRGATRFSHHVLARCGRVVPTLSTVLSLARTNGN